MAEPKIARRCLNCGAAVRGQARFCPQCGQNMGDAQPLTSETPAQTSKPGHTKKRDKAQKRQPLVAPTQTKPEPAHPPQPTASAASAESADALGRTQRDKPERTDADAAARSRGARLRAASVVMLDEAQDDPALRFVLVAAVLFVLFLFILICNSILR